MSNIKVAVFAGGLAFVVNNFCVLLLLGLGSIDQWIFVKPMMKYALNIEPVWLGIASIYILGFFQYFIVFWVVIKVVLWLKKRRPPLT